MDDKKDFAGKNGFIWWTGIVESRQDPIKLGRCKVRCVGWDADNKMHVPTDMLPWATPMLPVNNPNPYSPKEGDMVVGFFTDGENAQERIIMGILPGIPLKGADPQSAYNDPRGATELAAAPLKPNETEKGYPRRLDEPVTSRLARNESISDSIVSMKKAKLASKVEPDPTVSTSPNYYNAKYPYNNVYESESGHALEFDDTRNNERIHLYHRSGSYLEFGAAGDRVERIQKDKFSVVAGSDYVYVQGNVTLYVDGNITAQIGGSVNMTAASFNLTGDVNLNGSLVASGTVTDSGAVLATHTHSGVVAGGDNTGSPN